MTCSEVVMFSQEYHKEPVGGIGALYVDRDWLNKWVWSYDLIQEDLRKNYHGDSFDIILLVAIICLKFILKQHALLTSHYYRSRCGCTADTQF